MMLQGSTSVTAHVPGLLAPSQYKAPEAATRPT